ncbi:unnamed protein product, partial [Didymodactylos carnosus]
IMTSSQTKSIANPDSSTLKHLLEISDRSHYDIHYNVYFSNHLSHALVALHKLGATNERLEEFRQFYIKQLDPPKPKSKIITQDNWHEYLGKLHSYAELGDYFDDELKRLGSKERLLEEYLPKLVDVMSGDATHGIINLGYAVHSPYEQSLTEALAYMVYSYVYLGHLEAHDESGVTDVIVHPYDGCNEFVQLLKYVNKDALTMQQGMEQKCLEEPYCQLPGTVAKRLFIIRDTQEYSLKLQQYARQIKTIDKVKDEQLMELAHALSVAVLLAYEGTIPEPDNFFMLHGVTSCWAFRQTLKYFTNPKQLRSALYSFVMTIVAVYLTQGIPEFILRDGSFPLFNIDNQSRQYCFMSRKEA